MTEYTIMVRYTCSVCGIESRAVPHTKAPTEQHEHVPGDWEVFFDIRDDSVLTRYLCPLCTKKKITRWYHAPADHDSLKGADAHSFRSKMFETRDSAVEDGMKTYAGRIGTSKRSCDRLFLVFESELVLPSRKILSAVGFDLVVERLEESIPAEGNVITPSHNAKEELEQFLVFWSRRNLSCTWYQNVSREVVLITRPG